jgi:hypothetical protein
MSASGIPVIWRAVLERQHVPELATGPPSVSLEKIIDVAAAALPNEMRAAVMHPAHVQFTVRRLGCS